ncbi:cupin-like domain-containing protein [Roseateles sp. DC23W]|uniref:Cupin-like domain-containing protein n=1 Tax=Pelomonas dachongensis TaxID=3299029 RepID=A0ABW7EKK0_9BURK
MPLPPHALATVAERRGVDARAFQQEILPAGQPVILRGLVDDWPAVQRGQASARSVCEYLMEFYQGKVVPLLIGDPAARRHIFYQDLMAGLNFERRPATIFDGMRLLLGQLDEADAPAIYMESLPVADCLPGFAAAHAMPLLGNAVSPNIWIGNAVKVQTHFDLKLNLACLVAGKRRFTLFPPDQLPNLYVGPLDFTPAGTPLSMVTLDNPDLARYPRFQQALDAAQVADLEPGDALYIPYAWWHHVESLEPFNILVNYWWTQTQSPVHNYDALLHAVLAFRDMPAEQRQFWRQMFDYFVFETGGEALGHLAPEHRGHLGPVTPEKLAAIKAMLAESLGRR